MTMMNKHTDEAARSNYSGRRTCGSLVCVCNSTLAKASFKEHLSEEIGEQL